MTSTPEPGAYFEWVAELTRGQLLDLVLEIEARLRQVARAVFCQARPDWERLIPGTIRNEIESSGPPKGSDLLDRATLGQLIGIVLSRWNYFAELLGDKPTFQVRAGEFRDWRNSLAHGADPTPDQKVEIGFLVRQVGQQIPIVGEPAPPAVTGAVAGSTALWVDDHPEWNLQERQVLRALGIDVIPVFTNQEAVAIANEQPVDIVISDIERGSDEPGTELPKRLRALGIDAPVVFYVGTVDLDRGTPPDAASIQDDPALLVRDVLNLLSARTAS
jgi:hypothetical protein